MGALRLNRDFCEAIRYNTGIVFYHGFNGLDGFACVYWVQYKNIINPLERMEGCALLLCFHFGLIRASSLRPKRKHTITFILKVTILAKAINKDKPFPSSGVLPSRQRFSGVSYIRGRCPRLLRVVPSRHQSACGFYFYHGLFG